MWRGLAKGAALAAVGRIPGGPSAYRTVTREWLGTQATHVDKLRRVWPEYARVWPTVAGIELDGARVWVHEGGSTPYPSFATFLLTGAGGVVTNRRARVSDRYLARAVNGALATWFDDEVIPPERRAALEPLRWAASAREAIESVGGQLFEGVDSGRLPLENGSIDLCHSGGVLEHEEPRVLEELLREARRILRPGGVMSHVVDHRDHLHHADPGWGFLSHLRWSPRVYAAVFGNPLTYHNRLPPSRFREVFERAGFEPIAIRRLILPGRRYVDSEEEALAGRPGIARAHLARAFRDMSDIDLRTAAAHYLFRRPG
jgi:SAM-dependent methyltransferase